jgi:diphosphomevalonate decarboxylase
MIRQRSRREDRVNARAVYGDAVPSVTARACANIALVKYWGKRDAVLNLPATGSLSLTLDALVTTTTVRFGDGDRDTIVLDGAPARGTAMDRIVAFLDLVRAIAGTRARAAVESSNNFPTASGLASSASGFAALAVAATRAAGVELGARELSVLARRGSGSAARSIFGGLVRMHEGAAADGNDAYAEPLTGASDIFVRRLRMVIAVVGGGAPKSHASRDAMEHTAETSPLYPGWLAMARRDLGAAEDAIAAGDLARLGEIAEASALAMHVTAMAARPPIQYWQPATLAVLAAVRSMRAAGRRAYATIDAGPHVKVLCDVDEADGVVDALQAVSGIDGVIASAPGRGAEVVDA